MTSRVEVLVRCSLCGAFPPLYPMLATQYRRAGLPFAADTMETTMFDRIFRSLDSFVKDESGAVTVDFVVLTAAIMLLGLTAVNSFDEEVVDLANEISDELDNIDIGS